MASDLLAIIPELIILITACSLLVVASFRLRYEAVYSFVLVLASVIVAAIVVLVQMPETSRQILHHALYIDKLSSVLKFFILLISALVFVYSRPYLKARKMETTEYYALGLFAILGMMVMTGSASMLSVYMGLELMSLSLYAMVAYRRDAVIASEAAMKYFVLGAIASGMLLYGISFVYGISGSLELSAIASVLTEGSVLALFAMLFIVAGLLFKLGAVPFHMWLPDVYQGAPTSVTLFISAAPKIATFAMVMRLLVEGLGNLSTEWQQVLIVAAIASVALGNIVAIAQTNLKRMFAYSGIAHMGFFLLGILAGTNQGYAAAMFYVLVYALTTAGGFGMILLLSKKGYEAENLADYKGLAKHHPWYAALLLILLFSMAGVPPTVGFYAKLSVLQAVVAVDLTWLAVTAVVFSIIGAYYYLRVVVYLYFSEPEGPQYAVAPPREVGALLSVNALAVLALGLFPTALMMWCVHALQ